MSVQQQCYLRVFGVEVGLGAEDEICRRVRNVDGVVSVSWRPAGEGLCLRTEQPGTVARVVEELRRLGFVPSGTGRAGQCGD